MIYGCGSLTCLYITYLNKAQRRGLCMSNMDKEFEEVEGNFIGDEDYTEEDYREDSEFYGTHPLNDEEDGDDYSDKDDENTTPDLSGAVSESNGDTDSLASLGIRIKSKLEIKEEIIDIDSLVTSKFKQVSREETLIGLTGVVGEWGVVTPIHVLQLEDEDMYMILDGLRRTAAALRNGKKQIKAVIWVFDDKEEGKDLANVLSLMINRSQKYRNKELWEQMKLLEEVNDATPSLIEYLLQMHSGDAMKLKDIMLADMDYDEIKQAFLDEGMTIDAAYKKLCAARKKENRLAKEDSMILESGGTPDAVSAEDFDDGVPVDQHLGTDEVKSLLGMTEQDIEDTSLEDLDRTAEVRGDVVQKVGERHPVDAEIKQAVMIRDEFKCRCCGLGGERWLGVLVYHHIVPVFLGGPDTVDNGLTICSNCHLTLHLYSFGKVPVDLDALDDAEKTTFKNIFKFGNIIIEGMKRVGVSKDAAYKADAGSRRHLMPGEGLSDNTKAFKESGLEG